MRFSIIVPVYNVKRYLQACVKSVLCQSFEDYELLLVDDGSTDGSGALCDELAAESGRIKVFHQENRGLSGARNTGIGRAAGDYLLFLDADDALAGPAVLETVARSADGCDVAAFNWKEVPDGEDEARYPARGPMDRLRPDYPTGRDYLRDALGFSHLYPWYAVIYAFRRAFWESNGFRFRQDVRYEDVELTPRVLLTAGRVRVTAGTVYLYRTGRPGSTVNTVDAGVYLDALAAAEGNIDAVRADTTLDGTLRDRLCNDLSCMYYSVLICSSMLTGPEREHLWTALRDRRWMCRYTTEKRQMAVRACLDVFGVPFTARLLGLRRRLQGKGKPT